jgi:nucleoside-diphosphate-sugar epimerase
MTYTVLGSSGFIGSHLARRLRDSGAECFTPGRGDPAIFERPLGHVFFCIGLTADYRGRPFDTVDAHVCRLLDVLRKARFESLLYLSSTRLYAGSDATDEDTVLRVDPGDPDNLYDISKIAGESLCHAHGGGVRVARLSNVCGVNPASEMFFDTVLRDAVTKGKVVLRTAPESAKDYMMIDDAVEALIRIANGGRSRVYNVASGRNISHAELLDGLRRVTGCEVEWTPGAEQTLFPPIAIDRLRDEFGMVPASPADHLDVLAAAYKQELVSA